MEGLWQVLLRATAGQGRLSCDDCFVLIDYLSDLLAEGYPRQAVLSIAERFLQRCPACQDEHSQELIELLTAPAVKT